MLHVHVSPVQARNIIQAVLDRLDCAVLQPGFSGCIIFRIRLALRQHMALHGG
jgi:hypothetical protein